THSRLTGPGFAYTITARPPRKMQTRPSPTSTEQAARRSPFRVISQKSAMSLRRLRRRRSGSVESTLPSTQRARCCASRSSTQQNEEFDSMFDINAKAAFFFIKQAGIDLNE